MRKFLGTAFIILIVISFASCLMLSNSLMSGLHLQEQSLTKPSILFLELEGVIIDGKDFLENLKEYAKDDDIKGVLIQVNSPGGVVGPSQELYTEIKRVRDELKKPVVVSCLGLTASGGYYAAVAADKIVTNPGALLGSIGVIMEFVNLEKLYEWAKVKRYSINTGAYKDSGAEYREMRDDERQLFQSLANEVLLQFKKTVAEGRKLSLEFVSKYADGRIMTGATAVALGFADKVGTLEDAKRMVGQLAGLGEHPEIFTPPPKRPDFLESIMAETKSKISLTGAVQDVVNTKLLGQPLYLMPGFLRP